MDKSIANTIVCVCVIARASACIMVCVCVCARACACVWLLFVPNPFGGRESINVVGKAQTESMSTIAPHLLEERKVLHRLGL